LVGEVDRGGGGRRGGNENPQSPRRRSVAKTKVNPAVAAARQFASSNTTVNTFMGGKYKSWMTTSGDINTSSPANKQKRTVSRPGPTALDPTPLPHPSLLMSPDTVTTSPQQMSMSIPSPGSGQPPTFFAPAAMAQSSSDYSGHQTGPLPTGNSSIPHSTRRTDIHPPSNSTSPHLANAISIQKDSGGLGNKQTLPSPTPSDDVAQRGRRSSHPVGMGDGSGEQRSGLPATESTHPSPPMQEPTHEQPNARQSPNITDAQPNSELSEKLNELMKQYGAENISNILRLSDTSARASPSEGISGASSGHSSVPRKRPSDGPLERSEFESRPHSPTTQLAQPLDTSAIDKRRRINDPPPQALPSPRPSMMNSPNQAQGQFQNQSHNQSQNQLLSQMPSQLPNQASTWVPNQTTPSQSSGQALGQIDTHVSSHGSGPPSSGTPTHTVQASAQAPLVPPPQRRPSTTTTTPTLPLGYGLQEKRNQHICGTTPNRRIPASQNRPTLGRFLPMVDREFRPDMEQNTELPRMRLLREACQEEDWFYVALHQMYCLFSIHQQALAGMIGFSQKHLEGFQVVRELIKENHLLPQERLAWFAQFPSPLQALYSQSDLYRHAVSLVKDFISVLPEAYSRFQNDCRARGTPPLVHELVIVMKLQSLIFQRVVYIAIRRSMWGPVEDEYTRKMHEVFQKNQREYLAILDRQDTAQPASVQYISQSHQQIAAEYSTIRTQQLEHYNVNSSATSSSLSQAQRAFRSFQTALPPQNGPRELNGQSVPPTPTASAFSSQPPTVQGHNHNNAVRNTITQTVPRGLSVNTQAASEHFSTSLPSATNATYTVSPQTPGVALPATPGITAQMQLLQMQRMRQQQEQLERVSLHRRANQNGQQHPSTRTISLNQITPHTVQPSSSAHENSLPASSHSATYPSRRQIVSVAAGAPDPRFNSTTGVFPPGIRQHPMQIGRPTHNRARGSQTPSLLLPSNNYMPTANPGLPNPTVTALHQAHLRSPHLKCATPPPMNKAEKLYQYVRSFPLQPMIFPHDRPLLSYQFDIPVHDSEHIASYKGSESVPHDSRDLRRIRIVRPGSLLYRIRCVKLPTKDLLSEDKWVTSESKWPDHIFIDVNQAKMETRRKQHFGKDLPIDITDYVQAGGNTLKVSILRSQRETHTNYAIAVEAIEVTAHSEIIRLANQNVIPAEQSLNAIKTSLNAIPDDDEIAVVNNDLIVNISDPFSARVFDIPARGHSCLHRECFDLETFFATRASKPKRPTEPCMVDEWKCPLCASDARPHRLLIDGFMLDVKRELDMRHLGEIRAIIVDKDGNWEPKIEPGDDDAKGEDSTVPTTAAVPAATAGAAGGNVTPAKEKVVVIIDLEDD
jgi:zinc finger MIZ domain-containing protein